jgi:hypothetical protein
LLQSTFESFQRIANKYQKQSKKKRVIKSNLFNSIDNKKQQNTKVEMKGDGKKQLVKPGERAGPLVLNAQVKELVRIQNKESSFNETKNRKVKGSTKDDDDELYINEEIADFVKNYLGRVRTK